MPKVTLTINVEGFTDKESYKKYLNHENFDVYSSKEDETNFTMVQKVVDNPESVKTS